MAINKRLLAKRDMNFFAEFTANAAKMRRLFGYAVVIGVIVVGVLLAIVGYDLIRNALIKAEITSLKIVLEPMYTVDILFLLASLVSYLSLLIQSAMQ